MPLQRLPPWPGGAVQRLSVRTGFVGNSLWRQWRRKKDTGAQPAVSSVTDEKHGGLKWFNEKVIPVQLDFLQEAIVMLDVTIIRHSLKVLHVIPAGFSDSVLYSFCFVSMKGDQRLIFLNRGLFTFWQSLLWNMLFSDYQINSDDLHNRQSFCS